MKILYIAGNPPTEPDLTIDKEVSELQVIFQQVQGEEVTFVPCPFLAIEDLGSRLSAERPDILHIAAHAGAETLLLADRADEDVELDAARLRALLSPEHPPRLIFLAACDSLPIAEALVRDDPNEPGSGPLMVIASTETIRNDKVRACARLFYERLLAGGSVFAAHRAANALLATGHSEPQLALRHRADVDPRSEFLHRRLAIEAWFDTDDGETSNYALPDEDGNWPLRLSLGGCPADTTQVVFYTDEDTFLGEHDDLDLHDETLAAADTCLVVRRRPLGGEVWTEKAWAVGGDVRLVASAITSRGRAFTVSVLASEALREHYRQGDHLEQGALPAQVVRAIRELRHNGGTTSPWEEAEASQPSRFE